VLHVPPIRNTILMNVLVEVFIQMNYLLYGT